MDITHITSLLGGIALFLYGMSIMGAGLEKLPLRQAGLSPHRRITLNGTGRHLPGLIKPVHRSPRGPNYPAVPENCSFPRTAAVFAARHRFVWH